MSFLCRTARIGECCCFESGSICDISQQGIFSQRFRSRDQFKGIPLKDDFDRANKIIASVWSLTQTEGASVGESDVAKLLNVTRSRLVQMVRTQSALEHIQSIDDLQSIMELNGTAQATVERRTPEWLEANGAYLDELRVRLSFEDRII